MVKTRYRLPGNLVLLEKQFGDLTFLIPREMPKFEYSCTVCAVNRNPGNQIARYDLLIRATYVDT